MYHQVKVVKVHQGKSKEWKRCCFKYLQASDKTTNSGRGLFLYHVVQSVSPLHYMVDEENVSEPGILSGLPESLAYEIFILPLNIFLLGDLYSDFLDLSHDLLVQGVTGKAHD
ncbi:hypothetical protein E2C01_023983 [Portunus trituberculatus]|uniref:Uncharacterized protein n=1 Tax=Portunus trituberculatus TaxID=210409 RepID=A0A5B7ECM4_PORTR|nr:hypothetical protein [Portunus trituberculatus]